MPKKKTELQFAAPEGKRWRLPEEIIQPEDDVLVMDLKEGRPELRRVWPDLLGKSPLAFNILVLADDPDAEKTQPAPKKTPAKKAAKKTTAKPEASNDLDDTLNG